LVGGVLSGAQYSEYGKFALQQISSEVKISHIPSGT
jgi:hypothetical protein